MFRSNSPARVLGTLGLAVVVATASIASNEAPSRALKLDPRAEQRAAAAKRAPAGTAVPADRYLAAAEQMANMPSYSTAGASLDSTVSVVGTWSNLGPSNAGGRTRALIVQPGSPNTWFAAGVAGGVFKTTDAGLNWTALGDTMANMAVSSLVMKPTDTNTLLAGTGEGFFNEDLVRGAGIFKSTDGGATWAVLPNTNLVGNTNFHYVNDIVWSASTNAIYAATAMGVFKSINEGSTWTQILTPAIQGGCLDLSLAPGATDFLVASCGTSIPGGTAVQARLYRAQGSTATSTASWTVVLSEAGMGRTSLASDPAVPGVVYALSANPTTSALHAVFRSADGGAIWVKQLNGATDVTDNRLILQNAVAARCFSATEAVGWYANAIAIDPSDVTGNTVWAGSIDIYRSTDGGLSWGPMSSWWQEGQPQHVPSGQHALVFGAGSMLVAGDSGIYRMTTPPAGAGSFAACPGGGTVSSAVFAPRNNGYAVTQFNSAAVNPNDTTYIGGTQRSTLLGTDGAGPAGWTRIWAEYGGAAAIDPTDPSVVYVVEAQGAVRKSTDGGATFPDHPTGPGGNWSVGLSGTFANQAPFAIDPTNPNRLWIAGERVFRSDDGGDSWTAASAVLLSTATALAVSPANPDAVAVGTSTGQIYRTATATTDSGTTAWASVAPRTGYVSSLAFDATNVQLVYVTYATFSGVHLWKSVNGGASWADADGAGVTGIPDVPVHSVAIDPTTPARIYAGTDVGVFVSLNSGTAWAKENTGFPNVITERLVANGANLYAFTHGRGAWRVPLTTAAVTTTVGFEAPRTTLTENGVVVSVDLVLSTSDHLPLSGDVSVNYASANGTAVADADFTPVSGSFLFASGSAHGSRRTIDVTILEDAVGEPNESFALNLSAPTGGALLARANHTVVVEDDADPPGLSVSNLVVSETSATASFTVSLIPALPGTVTVNFATVDGSALAGVVPNGDYTATSGLLTFAPGNTSKQVTVTLRNDTVAEAPETFSLILSGALGAAIVDNEGVATINDNDLSGSLQFSAATFAMAETGPKATITVTRTGGIASGVSVQYATSNGTATTPADYTPASGTLNFAAGVASQTFQVTLFNDTLDELDETVNLALSSPGGYGATLGAQSTAALSITDNDAGGEMAFSLAGYTGNEGTSPLVTVKRTGGTASAVTVDYAAVPGSATFPADYGVPTGTGTLSFAAGELTKTFSVPLVAENPIMVEGDETFQVVLSNPQGGATISPTFGTANITIADASPRVAFQAVTTTVSESLTTVSVVVVRTGPTTTAVTVPYFTTNGSATAPADYTAASANLVIPAGITSKPIAIVLKTDTVFEGPENFTVTLGAPIGGILGANTVNTVNITDNDLGGALAFSVATFNVNEPLSGVLPAKATITVKRTGGIASGVTVDWTTSDGTATAPGDYNAASGTLTFDAGIISKTFTVDALPDADVEGYEGINLTLSNPTGGASLGAQGTASINIVDSEPVVQFTPAVVTVSEGGLKATFSLKRTGVLTGALSVSVADLGGTATSGGDYGTVPTTVVMPTGAASKTFTVDILQDAELEMTPETVNLALTDCGTVCTVGPLANAVLTINDDEPLVSFSLGSYTVTEGTAKVTLTLKRTGSTVAALTVGIADLLTGSATPGVDYNNVPTSVIIPAKAATKTFTIDIVNDLLGESAETIALQVTSVSAGGFLAPTLTNTVVNLNDNEPSIAFSLPSYTLAEPSNAVVTPSKLTIQVKRTGTLTQVSTVAYSIVAGTATAGVDYNLFNPVAASGTLTFASGVAAINIVIDILGDLDDEPSENILLSLSSPTGAKLGVNVNATANITDND